MIVKENIQKSVSTFIRRYKRLDMTNISVEEKINIYLAQNPELAKISRETLVSIMVQKGALSMTEAQKISAFSKTGTLSSEKGTTLEHAEKDASHGNQFQKTTLTREQAQDLSMDYLSENLQSAIDIIRRTDNGYISEGYDNIKNVLGTKLSSKNVGDVLDKEYQGLTFLQKARDGKLTKREYYEHNKERLKEMIIKRFERKDETGISYLDKLRGNFSGEEFTKILDEYITKTTDSISTMKGIKDVQHKLIMLDDEETADFISKIARNAKTETLGEFSIEGQNKKFPGFTPDTHPFDSDEPMTFEETFELERGTKFDKNAFENLQQSKGEMSFATGAYNKTQELKNNVKLLLDEYAEQTKTYSDIDGNTTGGNEPPAADRADKISAFFADYYSASPESAKNDLASIMTKQKLDLKISQDENGKLTIGFGELFKTDAQKNKALNTLLKVSAQEQDNKLTKLLGGKTYESYLEAYQNDYKNALGKENVDELAKAMRDDQMTVVEKYSGLASMGGMAVMCVGGILTLTPAAPLGMGMVATGGKVAMAGMAAKNVLGFTEELSRDEVSDERMTLLKKILAMDIGGLIIGGAAGRQGMKYASQILRNGGNKALAVLAEKGTDFTLSAAGDLAMIGALNYDEGLAETLKNNGIGIVVSTITGLKASKELFKGEFDPQMKQKNSPVLEGGVRADELEEVAPFAQRLENPPHVGDYIDVPETKLILKDFRNTLTTLKNKDGKSYFYSDYTINKLAERFGKKNLPEISANIGEIRTKFGDEFAANIITVVAGNNKLKPDNAFSLIKNITNEFDNIPENCDAIESWIFSADSNSIEAAQILLDMPKRENSMDNSWRNVDDLLTTAANFDDKKSIVALKRAVSLKSDTGANMYELKDIYTITNTKDLLSSNVYTDEELKKLKFAIIGLYRNLSDLENVSKVLVAPENKTLQVQVKDILNNFNNMLVVAKIRELQPQVYKKIDGMKMSASDVQDKQLKSLLKRNIKKINDPQKRIDFIQQMKTWLPNLSEVKDKYILGKIHGETAKIVEWLNRSDIIVDSSNYSKLKTYMDIDKEFHGEETYSYGNATEYLSYMEKEYPDDAKIFKDLVANYQTMPEKQFEKYFKIHSIPSISMLDIKNYIKDKKIQTLKNYMRENLESNLNNYSKKSKDNIKRLYKEKYLTLLPQAARERCEKIYDSFGVKMFLADENDTESLDFIYNELMEWQKASKGKAVLPPTIDLSVIKQGYIDKVFKSGGYHEFPTHNISVNARYLSDIKYTLRHEIAHANDSKVTQKDGIITVYNKDGSIEDINIDEIIVHKMVQATDGNGNPVFNPDGTPLMVKAKADDGTFDPDLDKCKYVKEFENAGIPDWHIPYAYTNKADFLAVASEGDYSKYSKEFKELLVKFGLPDWMFKMNEKNSISINSNLYTNEKFSHKYTLEENRKISAHSEDFYNWVVRNKDDIKTDYQNCFGSLAGTTLQHRVKDLSGLNEKIYREIDRLDSKIADLSDIDKFNAEKLKKGDEPLTQEVADIFIEKYNMQKQRLINDYDTVRNTIQDAYGARLVMDDTSPASISKVHRSLLDAIDSGEIKLLEINNYQGEGGIPYFSSVQIKQLQAHCRRQGYEVIVISDVNAPKGKEDAYSKNYNSPKAVKASGYTTCQMNIQHKSGVISEFQIRGKHINELAESEHIFYDISQKKDLSKGNPAIKQLTDPLVKVVEEMNAEGNEHIKEAYSKYLTECYKYARMQELGISMAKPSLPAGVDPMLDIDNIIYIHSKMESLK